ncbi:hypothetical protein BH09BAC6_BH09BAC6_13600 [soil metagenome]|jgi:PAS domain S-box-containing protein
MMIKTEEIGVKLNSNKQHNLELFFELSPDLLCIAGFDGYFKRINPTVSKVLGYTNEELLARPIHEFIYHEDRNVTAQHRRYLVQDMPLLHFENRYVTKSGELVWLSWTSMPVDSEQVVFAIAKTITHKKKVDEDRNSLIEELTQINKELKQLTYTTSHDLRTPVGNLLSVFSLLDVTKIQDEETLEFINILKLATENLKSTLNNYVDVLDQKESLHIKVEVLSLAEILQVVLRSLNSLIKNSKTSVTADFSELEHVKFNRAYLESVFLNLITNAIKYARPGYFPVISIRSQKVNNVAQLIFRDEGLGFDMDKYKGKIFGFQQKFHEHADSKGIGLYLVYNHITSLGGQIVLESEPNAGSMFTITFRD